MTITPQELVAREVCYCVSSLIHTLAQETSYVAYSPELTPLLEQAYELAMPIDDWLEAAECAGWNIVFHHGAGYRAVRNDAATDDDVTCYAASPEDAAREACEIDGIEPHQCEVYEHWIVSDWLADELAACGEKVDKDFDGMTVWARTTTGQAIYMDAVIERICAALNDG